MRSPCSESIAAALGNPFLVGLPRAHKILADIVLAFVEAVRQCRGRLAFQVIQAKQFGEVPNSLGNIALHRVEDLARQFPFKFQDQFLEDVGRFAHDSIEASVALGLLKSSAAFDFPSLAGDDVARDDGEPVAKLSFLARMTKAG